MKMQEPRRALARLGSCTAGGRDGLVAAAIAAREPAVALVRATHERVGGLADRSALQESRARVRNGHAEARENDGSGHCALQSLECRHCVLLVTLTSAVLQTAGASREE